MSWFFFILLFNFKRVPVRNRGRSCVPCITLDRCREVRYFFGMPRHARLDTPGALHHIMVRGINKEDIFIDDTDRRDFLRRLGETIIDDKSVIYAWALMGNHIHLLVRSGIKGIGSVMRRVLTGYAVSFNKRHQRTGHLFENRYKSILCEEEYYFLALLRYIHLNPVRAGITKDLPSLDSYPWSGHKAVIGETYYPWMDTDYILRQFTQIKKNAIKAYRDFIKEGITLGRQPNLIGGGLIRTLGGWSQVVSMRRSGASIQSDDRILGSSAFVQSILKEAEKRYLRQLKIRSSGKTITNIIHKECHNLGVSLNELQGGGRRKKVSDARATIAYRATTELGLSGAEIARHLGVTTSSITRAVERMEREWKQ
jgi:putative transposase